MNYDSGGSHKLSEMSFRETAYRYRGFYVRKPAWGASVAAPWRLATPVSQLRPAQHVHLQMSTALVTALICRFYT